MIKATQMEDVISSKIYFAIFDRERARERCLEFLAVHDIKKKAERDVCALAAALLATEISCGFCCFF